MGLKKTFDKLIKISLIVFTFVLVFVVMLKAIMPKDLISNYNYLSTLTLKERFVRGLKILTFYKIEAEIGVLTKTIILDILNVVIFIPLGIFIAHLFKKNKIINTCLVSFAFSLFIELFQLFTIIGSFMLNDLIINVLGGLLGAIIYVLVTKKKQYKIYNILLSIFLLLSSAFLLYLSINLIINIDVYIDILTK